MTIDFSNYVEGHLTGIEIKEFENEIQISLQGIAPHISSKITLSGVERFVVHEMRERNIIDRISLWDTSSTECDYKDSLIYLITDSPEQSSGKAFSSAINMATEAINAGSKILFEVDPVYGAHIIALATTMTLSEI